jgi:hypothetical protein
VSEAHTADLGTRYRYRQEGAELERERIIKLIEDWQENLLNGEAATDQEMIKARENRYKDSFDYLFALIKGEQND